MARTLRINGDSGLNGGSFLVDDSTRQAPVIVDNTVHTLEFGLFSYGSPRNLSDFSSIDVEIVESQTDATAFLTRMVGSFTNLIALSDWNNGFAENFSLSLSASELNYNLSGAQKTLWMVVTGNLTAGGTTFLCAGEVTIIEDGVSSGGGSGGIGSGVFWDQLLNVPSTFAPSAHTHAWSEITSKPTEFTPESHTHSVFDGSAAGFAPQVTGGVGTTRYLREDGTWVAPSAGGGIGSGVFWDQLLNVPSTFAPSAHTHAWSEITSKPTEFTPESHTHSVFDGSAAGFAPQVTGGVGTTRYLREDGTWVAPSAGGGIGSGVFWDQLLNVPSTFAPSAHTHAWSEITSKPTVFTPDTHSHSVFDENNNGFAPSPGPTPPGNTYLNDSAGWQQVQWDDIDQTPEIFSGDASGFVPQVPSTVGTTRYLREDATWVVPPDNSGIGSGVFWDQLLNVPSTFAPSAHTHAWSEITSKPTEFTPESHTHSVFDGSAAGFAPQVTGGVGTTRYLREDGTWVAPSAGGGIGSGVFWDQLLNVPSTFAPSAHTHAWSEITSKPTEFTPESHTHSVFDGSAAGFAPQVTGGVGTTRYLREDGTWVVPPDNDSGVGSGVFWDQLINVPSTFAPSAHTHPWSEVTSKPTVFTPDTHTHVWGDITSGVPANLTSLGGLSGSANKLPYFTAASTFGMLDVLDEDDFSSDSATAVPTQQSTKAYVDANGGGYWALESSETISGTPSTVTFSLAADKIHKFLFVGVKPTADGSIAFRLSTNGGTSYDSGASDYFYVYTRVSADGTYSRSDDDTRDFAYFASSIGSASGERGLSGELTLFGASDSGIDTVATFEVTHMDGTGALYYTNGSSGKNDPEVDNAIEFQIDGTTLASGKIIHLSADE